MFHYRERRSLGKTAAAAGAAIGACAFLVVTALAQDTQPQPNRSATTAGSEPPPASSPAPAFQPGLIHELGRWLEEGASKFKSSIDGARERLDQLGNDARDAVKDAAAAAPTLPAAFVARERCLPAPNGAPDCQSAAEALCRGKGFKGGKFLDTQTEQKCPARVLLSGRSPKDNDCSTEIFITRAICQ